MRLVETGPDSATRSVDLIEIDRPASLADITGLGLTRPEAKQLLARVQQEMVAAQARDHAVHRSGCASCDGGCHVKDWRPHQIETPFGGVALRFRDGSVPTVRDRDRHQLADELPFDAGVG